jgi:hypothetical protein
MTQYEIPWGSILGYDERKEIANLLQKFIKGLTE